MTAGDARPAVVVGVGNVLRRDDAVGVRVVEQLRSLAVADAFGLPAGTRLVDGGTLGLDLLDVLDGARCLLVVDAVDLGLPAGAVRVLAGSDEILAAATAGQGSVGEGVGELVALARLRGSLPPEVALVGVQVADTGFGEGLTASVARAVPTAVSAARRELRHLAGPGSRAACGHRIAEGATA